MYNSEINSGTYWSAGELRRLDMMARKGWTASRIACKLKRSTGAVSMRLSILRTAKLFELGNDKDTLVSTRKDPRFNY